jgi:hypothetical protein
MKREDYERFSDLTYDDFKKMALDDSMSRYEKIGFPNAYREGKEERIFIDIKRKLPNLLLKSKVIMDIGPGCSELPFMLIDHCRSQGHTLILIDSAEMLSHLPDQPFIRKVPGRYPQECETIFDEYSEKVDAILTYSVLHYIFSESNLFDFIDKSLGLLSHKGQMLIGDIPNTSKRKRFFSSPNGVKFHQKFTGTDEVPQVGFNQIETGAIDDSMLIGLILRCRGAGFDAYLVPQADDLPMANRREDILITRP